MYFSLGYELIEIGIVFVFGFFLVVPLLLSVYTYIYPSKMKRKRNQSTGVTVTIHYDFRYYFVLFYLFFSTIARWDEKKLNLQRFVIFSLLCAVWSDFIISSNGVDFFIWKIRSNNLEMFPVEIYFLKKHQFVYFSLFLTTIFFIMLKRKFSFLKKSF